MRADPSRELIRAVGDDLDDSACRRLLREWLEPIMRAAARSSAVRFRSEADRDEVFNDIRITVFRKIKTWDPQRARFSSWIYGIVRVHLMNYVSRMRRRSVGGDLIQGPVETNIADLPEAIEERLPGETTHDHPSLQLERQGDSRASRYLHAFRQVYDGLSQEERVVVDHLMISRPHRELAERLGISIENAKVRAHRMKKRLKKEIERRLKLTKA